MCRSSMEFEVQNMIRDYYPFGDEYRSTGTETNYQFTGKELDSGSDLYYFGARYYDASIGRWLAPDLAHQYYSPYSYGGGNPLNQVDINGEYCLSPVTLAKYPQLLVLFQVAQNWAYGNGIGNKNIYNAFQYLNNNANRNFGGRPVNLSEFVPTGAGPEIVVGGTGNAGEYMGAYYESEKNIIHLNDELTNAWISTSKGSLEYEYYLFILLRTLLHETCHWATFFLQGLNEKKLRNKYRWFHTGNDIEFCIFGKDEPVTVGQLPSAIGLSEYKTINLYVSPGQAEDECQYYYDQGYIVYFNGIPWNPTH
jgi:RHS repeat-associated protein